MGDFDLSGVAPQFKEALLAVITGLKETKKKQDSINSEIEKWSERIKLAAEKGRTDLQKGAELKVEDLKNEFDRVKGEEAMLKKELAAIRTDILKEKFEPDLSVNADLLQAQFDMLLGEKDELEEKFEEESSNSALDELKKKMKDNGDL